MISINATLFLQIFHFLVLVYILNRLMFRPILKIIRERDRYMDETVSEVGNLKRETEGLSEKCHAIERDARAGAGEERVQMKKEATAIAEKLFDETKGEVASIREKVGKEVDDHLEKARKFLKNEASILADEITERVIGRR